MIVLDTTEADEKIREYLDKILDAAMEGDYKEVKHLAKMIRKVTIEQRKKITN